MDVIRKRYYTNMDKSNISVSSYSRPLSLIAKVILVAALIVGFTIVYKVNLRIMPSPALLVCVGAISSSLLGPIPSPQKIERNNKKAKQVAKAYMVKVVAAKAAQQSAAAQKTATDVHQTTGITPNKQPAKQEATNTAKDTEFECIEGNASGVTFNDIAGYEDTKESMRFIVECLTKHEKLHDMGAKVPTGILLYGPPGTGKTLFAKAIAGSSNTKMYMVSASQFVELYVGQGAKNVRSLFKQARENAPSIIFIDEIDAVGGRRTGQMHDERRQTLNALLVELNGTADNSGVMVIAATNDMDSLDPALLRPGRFDRKIAIPLPDKSDRKEIIKVHFKNKRIAEDVSVEELACMTDGMSGSGIATLTNEAAIHAVSKNKGIIDNSDFEAALFQILMDGEKKSVTNLEDLNIIAYHEAGHALATKLLTSYSVPTVTIIGSTSGAGGVTFKSANEERAFASKKEMEAHIKTLYAGRAAEECYFGNTEDITNGASSDLKQATLLIKEYLTTYGMGNDCLLNMSVFTDGRDTNLINEAKELANTLYGDVHKLLLENFEVLKNIADELLKNKTLDNNELTDIMSQHNLCVFESANNPKQVSLA